MIDKVSSRWQTLYDYPEGALTDFPDDASCEPVVNPSPTGEMCRKLNQAG